MTSKYWALAAVAVLTPITVGSAFAEKKYAPGVTDAEIKIGQTMPYSGPASAWGTVGLAELAYFRMINEHGGVNGRKIKLISLDDAFSAPKTVEQTRKLVEEERVAVVFGSIGGATNLAVRKYLNDSRVPQLFASTPLLSSTTRSIFRGRLAFNPPCTSKDRCMPDTFSRTSPALRLRYSMQPIRLPRRAWTVSRVRSVNGLRTSLSRNSLMRKVIRPSIRKSWR